MLATAGAVGPGNHASGGGGGGGQGAYPSNTSRFFSLDVGLFHLVAIDQNIYWEQQSEQVFRAAQLEWLRVRSDVIRNARIETVGKYQSCMFFKVRL